MKYRIDTNEGYHFKIIHPKVTIREWKEPRFFPFRTEEDFARQYPDTAKRLVGWAKITAESDKKERIKRMLESTPDSWDYYTDIEILEIGVKCNENKREHSIELDTLEELFEFAKFLDSTYQGYYHLEIDGADNSLFMNKGDY